MPVSEKIVARSVAKRPDYSEFFGWIKEVALEEDISIVANGDIWFGTQLRLFRIWSMPDDSVFALSRWDCGLGGGARIYSRKDSQDVWILRGKPRDVYGDFPLGVPRCDNRIAAELAKAGYRVRNPSFSLQAFHLHAAPPRPYLEEEHSRSIPPPYLYVWPENLWSWPRVMFHNLRHPESKLAYRFDTRRWSPLRPIRRARFHLGAMRRLVFGGGETGLPVEHYQLYRPTHNAQPTTDNAQPPPANPDPHHARVAPITDGQARPMWSVLIPCYNCAQFLERALESVLMQDPGPERMEIIVIDDCSERDDPSAVVERLGKGRVRFIRQERNVGKVRNYESGLLVSRGHLIHQLHGDDLVLPGFYEAMEKAFETHPEAGAFFCEADYIDEEGWITGRTGAELEETGVIPHFLVRIASAQRIQTPSMVLRRVVYEALGGFDRRLDCCEDWEMWTRVATRFSIGFSRGAHAQYRISKGNSSHRGLLDGTLAGIQRRMFQIVDEYLPEETRRKVIKHRNESQACYFATSIPMVMRIHGISGWARLLGEILKFSCSPRVLRLIASLSFKSALCKCRQRSR